MLWMDACMDGWMQACMHLVLDGNAGAVFYKAYGDVNVAVLAGPVQRRRTTLVAVVQARTLVHAYIPCIRASQHTYKNTTSSLSQSS